MNKTRESGFFYESTFILTNFKIGTIIVLSHLN